MRDKMSEHWNLHDIEVEASEEVMEDSYEEMVAEPVTGELIISDVTTTTN